MHLIKWRPNELFHIPEFIIQSSQQCKPGISAHNEVPLFSGSLNVLFDTERTQLLPEEMKRNLLLYVILVMVSLLSIRFRNGFDDSDTYRRENAQCQNLLTDISSPELQLFHVCTQALWYSSSWVLPFFYFVGEGNNNLLFFSNEAW